MAFLAGLSVGLPSLQWLVLGVSLALIVACLFGGRIVEFYLNMNYFPISERGRRIWADINYGGSLYISSCPL